MKFWSECTEKLEAKLSQEEFNTWIKPLKADIHENNLEITKNYSEARLFIALYIGEIRIIDNFKLY